MTLYLIVVLWAATRLGLGPAIAASVAAFIAYDWFFIEPVHTAAIADPAEWLALLVFLLTAIVTSQLASNERRRALAAERREREAMLLYEAARLAGEPDLDTAIRAIAERVRAELSAPVVAVELTAAGRKHALRVGDATATDGAVELLGAGRGGGRVGRWIRVIPPDAARTVRNARGRRSEVPIKTSTRQIGAIALVRETEDDLGEHESRLLALLAAQLGALAGRVELQEATTRGEILRRTDNLKSALLSAVSHDLRTPLASIVASAGSLRQRDVAWTDAECYEFLETIEQQAQRLGRIVGDLHDLSRIEAGALRPNKELHDARALIEDVVERMDDVTSGHDVRIEAADDLPPVPMDRVEIDQVLSNLLENAAKYSPRGTEILVSARVDDTWLRIDVADRGPGVAPGEIAELFTPFRRSADVGGISGTGVGLAVARGFVEAHGGRIEAGNRPDGGARFSFTLPIDVTADAKTALAR